MSYIDGLDVTAAPKIGILGGTFDPIHLGHIAAAKAAAEQLALDAVLVMPANIPSFKRKQRLASNEDRLYMCELALQDCFKETGSCTFEASDFEHQREGVTYTVETLEALRDMLPAGTQLFFILGADAAKLLWKWYRREDLAKLCTFAVVDRPGSAMSDEDFESLEELGYQLVRVVAATPDLSSTNIRALAAQNASLEGLVSPSVAAYIAERQLYREDGE